jgi:AcrR family transcriptional regulator
MEVCPVAKCAGRRERRSEETREKIYSAALQLFVERGFNGTTIEAITDLADVGKGTFFNYFDNKEHVILMFGEKQLDRIHTFVKENEASTSPLALLMYELAVSLTKQFSGNSAALFQSIIIAAFTNDTVKKQFSEGLAIGRETLAGLIAQRQRCGEIRDDLDAVDIAQSFQRMVFGTMVTWSLDPAVPLEENLKKTTDILLKSLQSSNTSVQGV